MQAQYATQSATLGVNADDVRVEELQGREHVVAPVTLVREMVLKGELLPFEEIEATQLAWNAKPGTISHPTNESGDFVPASHPAQYESHVTGKLFDVETSSTTRDLEGEIWIDRERSANVADSLDRDDPAELLLNGEAVEVSVGYWYERFEADGQHDGDEFDAVQVGIQPDHLALLPNGTGECSIEDGCGAGRDDAAGAAMMTDHQSTAAGRVLQWGSKRLNDLGIDFGAACDGCGGECGAHEDDEQNTDDTNTTMNDRIKQLAEQSAFDAETLDEWDESDLDALEESLDASDDGGDDPDTGAQTQDDSDDRLDTVLSKLDDLEEKVNRVEQEERKELTAQITANSGFESEDLEDYDLDALEKLADEVTPQGGVYAGRAGGASTTQQNSDGSDIPVGVGDRYLEEAE